MEPNEPQRPIDEILDVVYARAAALRARRRVAVSLTLAVVLAGVAVPVVALRARPTAIEIERLVAAGVDSSHQHARPAATSQHSASASAKAASRPETQEWSPSVSDDGDHIALLSARPTGGYPVITYDFTTGVARLVSVTLNGHPASGGDPSISADGTVVAFFSSASNLVRGDHNGKTDIFVRNMARKLTARVSVSSAGVESNGPSGPTVALAAGGTAVAFTSEATNLVDADTNGHQDIFIRDMTTHTTTRVVLSPGVEFPLGTAKPSISADARLVAFLTGSSGYGGDLYVFDRTIGTSKLIATNATGPALSSNGHFVSYISSDFKVTVADLESGTSSVVPTNEPCPGGAGQADMPTAIAGDGSAVGYAVGHEGGFANGCIRRRVDGALISAPGTAEQLTTISLSFDGHRIAQDGVLSSAVVVWFNRSTGRGGILKPPYPYKP